MNAILTADLRRLIKALDHEAHSISPSVYDTALVLRHAPPDPFWPAFGWLIDQQAADGGWGDPSTTPAARTTPTLAALLTLHSTSQRQDVHDAVARGCAWLRQAAPTWSSALADDIPVGVELLVPTLLDASRKRGLDIPLTPFDALLALGRERRARIAQIPAHRLAGSTAAHSWEALCSEVIQKSDHPCEPARDEELQQLVHPVSGVGASPAATAMWLRHSRNASCVEGARDYLHRAARATGVDMPGVVPTVFPVTTFMQAYGLHTLAQTGLLRHPALVPLVEPLLDDVARVLTADGIGFVPGFTPDADDTAAVLGALLAAGRPAELAPLLAFAQADHFATYRGELQPSLITTARAVHVLHNASVPVARFRRWIAGRQQRDGRWRSDKWNSAWAYSTWQAILALRDDREYGEALHHAALATLARQRPDGGWGDAVSTPEASAYALLALAALPGEHRSEAVAEALARGRRWLYRAYRPFVLPDERHWVGKEPYCPYRLSRLIVLVALLSTEGRCADAPSA